MALVIASPPAGPALDPTFRLREALHNFENVLSDEQKRQYKTNLVKPDASSVIKFVGQIDNENRNIARRCVAPRLCTFLEAIQQFSGIVDTFVSSNPTIAALVWGGVKTAILTANNVASYFEQITSMIMRIGKSCPTYQEFGQLYPGCVGLQHALCDYFAVVIQLCTKIIEVSRRSAFGQVLTSILNPFESEFKQLLIDLEQAAKTTKQQISLASKQADAEAKLLLEHECKSNAVHRSSASIFRKDARTEFADARRYRISRANRETAKLKRSVRDNLSTINYIRPLKQAMRQRAPSTAEWLQQESAFQHWKDDEETAIFWCSGMMGIGKSVLVSNVITQLHASSQPTDIISYYFCRSDHSASLSARNIMGTLTRQMLDTQIEGADGVVLQELHRESQDLDTPEVVDFLLSRLETDKTYFLILDGLDECDGDMIRQVASSIRAICMKRVKNFKILCTGRPELETQLFHSITPKHRVSVNRDKVATDMNQYIAMKLTQCLEEEQLKLGDPRLILEIQDTLQKGSDGMFLWVHLVIEELCEQNNDNDVLNALRNLPRGLRELFDLKLSRVDNQSKRGEAIGMLRFCGIVERPLTSMEYQEVLSISPGQTSLERGKFPNDMNSIIRDCCGLVFVDEEESTVHFVHNSVKQHLFVNDGSRLAVYDMVEAHRELGILCMTYLDFSDFKRQLAKVPKGLSTPIAPVQFGILPITRKFSIQVAQRLIRRRQELHHLSARELEEKVREAIEDSDSIRAGHELQTPDYDFYDYAKHFWIHHLADLNSEIDNQAWKLFCKCVEGRDVLAYRPWESEQQDNDSESETLAKIDWVLAHNHHALLLYSIRYQPQIFTESIKRRTLENTILHGRCNMTKIVAQIHNFTVEDLNFGSFYAVQYDCINCLSVLLEIQIDENAGTRGLAALRAAAGKGNLKAVEKLLSAKVNVDMPADEYQPTPLQAAAGSGHLETVERLLAAEADVNAPSGKLYGQTSLQAAAAGGHLDVVTRLLAVRADVNAPPQGSNGKTALQAAAERGDLEIVRQLLAAKANVNAPPGGSHGQTALQAAARAGHLKVVETLLDANAHVYAYPDRNGRTAIDMAAEEGHLEVVKRLISTRSWLKGDSVDNSLDERATLLLEVAQANVRFQGRIRVRVEVKSDGRVEKVWSLDQSNGLSEMGDELLIKTVGSVRERRRTNRHLPTFAD